MLMPGLFMRVKNFRNSNIPNRGIIKQNTENTGGIKMS